MPERLLVNYWYAHPVGHAVEGLRYCLGYKAANPELSVSLLLNGATPVELARLCPFVDEVYGVAFTSFTDVPNDPAAALTAVPRDWDWVVENHRARQASHAAIPGFAAFFDAAHRHFVPLHGTGVAGAEPPAYRPHEQLRLEPPADAREAAAAMLPADGLVIGAVLAGSSADRHLYPSTRSWEVILRALSRRHPDAVFCLIGKLGADGRTTSRITRAEVDRLLAAVPAVDCFDRPLLEQLAVLERSALLVSPHTGLSFLASTVGTPWLAISGGNWHEYFFNGVPVYSLLPDPGRYPSFAWAGLGAHPLAVIEEDDDGEGPRTPSMSAARIREDLDELLDAADRLINGSLGYEQALRDYFPRLLAAYRGDRNRVFSFDNIHEEYLGSEETRRVEEPHLR